MRRLGVIRRRWTQLVWRAHARIILLVGAVLVAAAVAAGLALARSSPIGTGVVVIDTNLGYEGGAAAGTGMVLTASGEVLTNNHVIRGATTIKIVVPGTGHRYTAKVVGYDVSADVAVLQASGASDLKTVAVGNSSTLKAGQTVTAVGNAGGAGKLTSSHGTVTALRRSITVSDDQGGSEHLTGLVETDAALEPGDSGGPLLNSANSVVALDTAGSVSYGLRASATVTGYAIPINTAVTIAKQIDSGDASTTVHVGGTAFLGVEVISVQDAGPDATAGSGAFIAHVTSDGAAAAAGLVAGDTITAIGGHTVSTPTALGPLILRQKPGARVPVTYRDSAGASHTAIVTLASGPPQ